MYNISFIDIIFIDDPYIPSPPTGFATKKKFNNILRYRESYCINLHLLNKPASGEHPTCV